MRNLCGGGTAGQKFKIFHRRNASCVDGSPVAAAPLTRQEQTLFAASIAFSG
jgi:hypothetical protein